MKKYFKFVLLLGIILIFLTGCVSDLVIPESDLNSEVTGDNPTSGDQEGGIVPGRGTLKIYLTDAPGDYKEVNINISRIEGHIAVEDEEGYWEPLKEWLDGLAVDLKELEDVSMLLASLELEPNKYTQLRIFLMGGEEDAWIVIEGLEGLTSTEPLEIPSVYQTGIKLNHPFEIVAGSITKLTIDFDAKKSVIETGNGKYKMKPVISVTSKIYSEEEVSTGLVSGTVSYDGGDSGLIGIGGASVSLSGGEYIFVYNTTTSGDGLFNFSEDVPVGNCVINVYTDGFDDYSESIVVGEGVNAFNVVLSFEEPGGISGSVVDLVSGELIEGATVSVSLSGGVYTFNSSTLTDEDGLFVIEQLPVGTYDLTASAIDYENYTADGIGVTEGTITENIEIELTLE